MNRPGTEYVGVSVCLCVFIESIIQLLAWSALGEQLHISMLFTRFAICGGVGVLFMRVVKER